MFHDMEEIIGMRKWLSGHYDDVVARIPMARKLLEPLRDIRVCGASGGASGSGGGCQRICAGSHYEPHQPSAKRVHHLQVVARH